MNWLNLSSIETINKLVEDSFTRDIIIFKHSITCGISHSALLRLESSWDQDKIDCYLLDIKSNRDISDQVAAQFAVHHESPQLLLIRKGECIYDASHFDISVSEIKETLTFHG